MNKAQKSKFWLLCVGLTQAVRTRDRRNPTEAAKIVSGEIQGHRCAVLLGEFLSKKQSPASKKRNIRIGFRKQ